MPCAVRTGSGTLTGHGVALAAVATYLTPVAGRLVIDRTDLSGRFDVAVRFAVPVDAQLFADAAQPFYRELARLTRNARIAGQEAGLL